jgi:hypothetical protein
VAGTDGRLTGGKVRIAKVMHQVHNPARQMNRDEKRAPSALLDRLLQLGVRGILGDMAKRGQIIALRCEMPKCYCHKGRGYFDPKSHPPGPWELSPDHYPRLKSDGGHLVPWSGFRVSSMGAA